MKIALCLSGMFNNRADPNSGTNGYKYILETILEKYDTDVFIHSWEPERKEELVNLYSPKMIVCENNKDFDKIARENGIREEYFNEEFSRTSSLFSACKVSSTLSFLYGRKEALEMCFSYPETYDCIIVARFDLGQRDKYQNRKYHVSTMNFNPHLDMSKFYSAMWDQLNCGYADQWFYSGEENMKLLSTIYSKTLDYFKPLSDYEKALTTGWKDSMMMDNLSTSDPRQFTNEMLKPENEKTSNLMKYPKWQVINNHLLHKWFCMDVGLYEKSVFI